MFWLNIQTKFIKKKLFRTLCLANFGEIRATKLAIRAILDLATLPPAGRHSERGRRGRRVVVSPLSVIVQYNRSCLKLSLSHLTGVVAALDYLASRARHFPIRTGKLS